MTINLLRFCQFELALENGFSMPQMPQFKPLYVMVLSEITHIISFPWCQTKMGICLHEIRYESAFLENEVCFRELGIVSPRIISSDTRKRCCMLVNNHARKQFLKRMKSVLECCSDMSPVIMSSGTRG